MGLLKDLSGCGRKSPSHRGKFASQDGGQSHFSELFNNLTLQNKRRGGLQRQARNRKKCRRLRVMSHNGVEMPLGQMPCPGYRGERPEHLNSFTSIVLDVATGKAQKEGETACYRNYLKPAGRDTAC